MGEVTVFTFVSGFLQFIQAFVGMRVRAALIALTGVLAYHVVPMWREWNTANRYVIVEWSVGLGLVALSCAISILWPDNLVKNGRFTSSTDHWGTGYLEDELRDGTQRHTNEVGRLPHRAYPSSDKTKSDGKRLVDQDGCKHFLRSNKNIFWMEYKDDRTPEHWGAVAQRIYGLKRGTDYTLRFCAKGSGGEGKSRFATANLSWAPNKPIPVSAEWKRYKLKFTSDRLVDYTEIRFVIQERGELSISHVTVWVPFWKRAL